MVADVNNVSLVEILNEKLHIDTGIEFRRRTKPKDSRFLCIFYPKPQPLRQAKAFAKKGPDKYTPLRKARGKQRQKRRASVL